MIEIDDFIEIYENSVSQELCKELIKWFDICSDNNFTEHNMQWSVRSDESISIPVSVPSESISATLCKSYWNALNPCFFEYNKKYGLEGIKMSCNIFKLHKVKEGQGYHAWHYESAYPYLNRVLVWMSYLKTPETGGETEFLYQKKRIVPTTGTTLIWPAYFTHLHRGNPPLKGEKYYITGWFVSD